MLEQRLLLAKLDQVARRVFWSRCLVGLAVAWGALWLLAAGAMALQPAAAGTTVAWALLLAGVAAVAVFVWTKARHRSPTEIARRLESLYPELDARLLTAVEQVPNLTTGRLGLLQQHVVKEALSHADTQPWDAAVPNWKLTGPAMLAAINLGILFGLLAWLPTENAKSAAKPQAVVDGIPIDDALPVTVEPGDVELERGSSLLVLARFRDELPGRVMLHVTPSGQKAETVPFEKSLDDPVFGARLPRVMTDLSYVVAYDAHETKAYKVTVYDLPTLIRSDLLVKQPEYTGKPEERLENAYDVTVVEGSRVTIDCRVNKPLASAALVRKNGERVALTADPKDAQRWTVALSPEKSERFTLELVDDRDRRNRDPDQFRIDVVRNKPPTLQLAFPGRDVRVSPLEELALEGRVSDDFGLDEYGVVLSVAGREPVTVPLGKDVRSDKPLTASLMQSLEDWKLQPDDLASFHLYAVDRGPDGKPRKTSGDLYFAEVRPFEETFRQQDSAGGAAASSSSQQQQQGNQFENMIQTQKQIVSATWNLVRQQTGAWTPKADEQVGVIFDSQHANQTKLLEQLTQMQGAAQQRLAGQAVERMAAAEADLDRARSGDSASPLSTALASEQAAYQTLLKLRARDHRVTKGQPSGGGSGGGASPSQQQLQELELSNKRNRYENRSQGAEAPGQAQQEELQVLDRLKELARRQGDLNEKLKELEAALRLAATAEQRDEIDRQLKRLREDQQQLWQDSDELRNRLAQSAQQEKFSEAREQLETTRSRQVEATEALREGQLSQALSSSNRAERELKQLQQDFRQQTSARFAEAMRGLREEVRELNRRETDLAERLANVNQPDPKPSLRQSRDREQLQGEFEQQRTAVKELTEQARQVVQDAETAEPLLSQQLYDTLRHARDDKLEPALEAVPQLLQRGFLPEAQRAETQVREGLQRLQAGVEKAAESVLGSEVESLKRARTELAELSQQLQGELTQNDGSGNRTSAQSNAELPNAPQEGTPGNPAGQGQPGEGQPDPNGQPGQQPGQQPGNQPGQGQGQQPGQGQGQGQQPGQGQGQGQQPGQGQGQGQQPGQGQGQGQGQQPGQGTGGQGGQPGGQGGGGSPSNQSPDSLLTPGNGQPGGGLRNGQRGGNQSGGGNDRGGFNGGGGNNQGGPIAGGDYREWSERLRDVESMVSDPALQAEVARLRDQARSLRAEFKRHSEAPNWSLVQTSLYDPLVELQKRLSEEVAKRESNDALVPIDRDPVPARYRDLVRSYYERLGRGNE
ncbi:MAG: DUF4175 family protein [Planctomycetaceae bacterium]|nr:DUF4175 family protein [Planctomycetaceae bacterium]